MEFLRRRLFFVIPFIALMGFMPISAALAASITLAWDPNPPEDEVAGYVVYYGKTPERYTYSVDVGNLTTCTLAGLTPGATYYIALTAYDASDNESDLSDEVHGIGTPVPPGITSLQIDGGASSTGSKTVILNNAATNKPTHFMASESPTFYRARWLVYSGAPKFTLSPGAGAKTVYIKAKNMDGESPVVSDTITLEGPAVSSFGIDGGAGSTISRTVTLNNTAINSPTHYAASESPTFYRVRWLVYSGTPTFTLSAGAGTKTVYFKVKNSVGESPVVSDTITLEGPAVSSFGIDGGAASTTSRMVTLNNTAINSPTHYMASESSTFYRVRWLVYSGAPTFTLSLGAGTKTVYFKVKNSVGESSVVSDTISLAGPGVSSLQINSGAAGTISRTVTLNNTAINSPTHYVASESSTFYRVRWLVYSGAPTFTLSAGAGTKTIYFKVKNSVGESTVVSDTITLE